MATDLFHIDTVLLRRWFVLFFIDHDARRVRMAGITRHPTGPWITQQARNYLMDLGARAESIKFLIRDRGAYFTDSSDAVFQGGDIDSGTHRLTTPHGPLSSPAPPHPNDASGHPKKRSASWTTATTPTRSSPTCANSS